MTETHRLSGWIVEQLAAKAVKLVLAHVTKGNKLGDEIRTVTVAETGDESWAHDTAERLVDQAAREALTLASGAQRYAVQAYFRGSDERPEDKSRARHLFTVAGSDISDGSVSSVSPDETGLVSLAQQNAQFFAKLASAQTMAQLNSQQEEIARLRKENTDLVRERLKTIQVMEELHSARAQRALDDRREETKARILEAGAEKIEMMLPMLINHLAGKQVFPENAAAMLMLKSWIERITPEQLQQMGMVLGPEQTAMLVQLGTTVSRMKPEEKALVQNGVKP